MSTAATPNKKAGARTATVPDPVVVKVARPVQCARGLTFNQWFFVGCTKEQALQAVNADSQFDDVPKTVLAKERWKSIDNLKQSCAVLDYTFVDVRGISQA